jgi:serine/threonine-protein kinase
MSGKYVVIAIVVIVAAVAGLLISKNRPRPQASLAPSLETGAGTMMLVQGGRFLHGQQKHTAIVPPFYMDRTEVTNEMYARFCDATNRPLPASFPSGRPGEPVVNVTIADATAYARWSGKRLPDALEWEKAARGVEGNMFPWGDEHDLSRANVADNPKLRGQHLLPADSMSEGASPFRLLHMTGNVHEYVRNEVTPSADAIRHFSAIMHPPPASNEPWYSVRGGAFNIPLAAAVPWEWTAVPARFAAPNIGFRCVKDPPR